MSDYSTGGNSEMTTPGSLRNCRAAALSAPSRVENSQSPTAAIASPTDPARSSSSERDTARTICSLFPVNSR